MIDPAGTAARSPSRTALTAGLFVLAVAALALRIPAIAEPLGIDQSLWASAVRGMARGQLLYRDVWEQRPPGIYWIYLTGFRILGWTAATVAWLDILSAIATTVLLFLTARRVAGRETALLASTLYATLTMPAAIYGYGGFLERSISETFIVVCVALCAWAAATYLRRPSVGIALAAGLAAGSALVLKPNAGLYFPALLVWTAFYLPRPRSRATPAAIAAVAAGTIMPLAALTWLWSLGLLGEAKTAVVDFNRFYVGQGFEPSAYALEFSKAVWLRMKTDPLWFGGAVGSVAALAQLGRRQRLDPLPALAMCWGTAAVLVIVVNGARLFNSYFTNALAPLALMAGWFIGGAMSHPSRLRRSAAALTVVAMVLLFIQRGSAARLIEWTRADLDELRGRTDKTAYLERFGGYANDRGYSARANTELADFIRQRTQPDDRIYLFGINGAGVYFESDRLTAHRFLRVNFFVDPEITSFPDPRFRLSSVLEELAARRPAYLMFEQLHIRSPGGRAMGEIADGLPQHPEVLDLLRGYRFETQIEDFSVYRRIE
jgi:4-amino-4-deoxy-L-arabinose transferase-like glycosyltransferase